MVEWAKAPLTSQTLDDVGAVEPQPCLRVHRRSKISGERGYEARQHEEHCCQGCVIQRKNSQGSPHVEIAKVALFALCVEQDPGDQKARQYEKQVHAAAAEFHEPSVINRRCRSFATASKAVECDSQ